MKLDDVKDDKRAKSMDGMQGGKRRDTLEFVSNKISMGDFKIYCT